MEYWILRCCERLGLGEAEFASADYDDQVRWLAYALLRAGEDQRAAISGQRAEGRN